MNLRILRSILFHDLETCGDICRYGDAIREGQPNTEKPARVGGQ